MCYIFSHTSTDDDMFALQAVADTLKDGLQLLLDYFRDINLSNRNSGRSIEAYFTTVGDAGCRLSRRSEMSLHGFQANLQTTA